MPTLTPSSEDTRIYECCVLYPTTLSQKDEQQVVKDVEGFFSEVGAKLVEKDVWGRRGLAYPIKGLMEGKFIVYYFEMDPLKVKEVDQALRIHKSVMRHMFVKPPKKYQVLKYSAVYEEWLRTRETVDQKQEREREEKLNEQVARKAKLQAKKVVEKKKPSMDAKPAMQDDVLTEKLEKLISDDSLDM